MELISYQTGLNIIVGCMAVAFIIAIIGTIKDLKGDKKWKDFWKEGVF